MTNNMTLWQIIWLYDKQYDIMTIDKTFDKYYLITNIMTYDLYDFMTNNITLWQTIWIYDK